MTRTGRSMVGFGAYAMIMGAGLLVAPNTMLDLLLTKPTTEHWIRLLGTSAIVLGSYYIVAGRNDLTAMARASLLRRRLHRGAPPHAFWVKTTSSFPPCCTLGMLPAWRRATRAQQ